MVDPDTFTVRLSGIGGTGVVTVSQIIGTAAMLDDLHVRGLDQTGLSQKAGPVTSDVRITRDAPAASNHANEAGRRLLPRRSTCSPARATAIARAPVADRTVVVGSVDVVPTGRDGREARIARSIPNRLRCANDSTTSREPT